MSFTWIRFNAALKAQGIDRKAFLPSVSKFQPYAGYWAFFWAFIFLWYVPFLSKSIEHAKFYSTSGSKDTRSSSTAIGKYQPLSSIMGLYVVSPQQVVLANDVFYL